MKKTLGNVIIALLNFSLSALFTSIWWAYVMWGSGEGYIAEVVCSIFIIIIYILINLEEI